MTRRLPVIFLLTLFISIYINRFSATAFLDTTMLLDRLKYHYWRSSPRRITSYAMPFSRRSSMAYIEQFHKRREKRKSSLLAAPKKDLDEKKSDRDTSSSSKTKRSEILFQQRLVELKDFIDANGHGSIPTPYEDNPPLGVWAANLRRQFVIREDAEQECTPYKGYLTEERLSVLKQSGFDFTSLTERQFKMRLDELKEFKTRYGHTLVPEKYEENMALGAWVSNMRTQYKKRRSEAESKPAKEIKIEDEIGIIKERYSKNMLEQKTIPVQKKRRRQRSKRNSQLDDEKERMLDEVGMVWNAIDRKWFEMVEWAKVYAVVNYELSSSRAENTSISLDASYGSFNRTDLDERDTILLDNYYTFVRDIQDPTLLPYFHPQDEILNLLLDENYGVLEKTQQFPNIAMSKSKKSKKAASCPTLDYRVPSNDALHYSLRIWMVNQRSNYHRRFQDTTDPAAIPSTMTDQRQKALEEINFPWSGRFANRCEELQYEIEQEEKNRQEAEKARKRDKKIQEENARIDELKVRQDSVPFAPATPATTEDDIMSLWGSEDDDDDGW